jgi:hypothetical protein
MLEKKLHEELNRYKAINKYGKTMIMEQDAPPAVDAPVDAPPPVDPAVPVDPAAAPTPDAAPMTDAPSPAMDSTEEVDITDLVNMVKSVKKGQEDGTGSNTEVIAKMDDVFSKLSDLESKLGEMDQVLSKIDQLGMEVKQMKPQTPQEKLEMRSLDSYPFNEKPQEFFAHKQGEMQASGKNEYVLTKDEVEDYSNNMIKDTFNPEKQEDEFRY